MNTAVEAWDAARAAAEAAGIMLRPLASPGDADLVRSLVAEVWGDESMPRALVVAFQHAGAILYGAEAPSGTIGFVLGFAGLDGGLHLHSHMLAVSPGWQSRGVGYALKLAQRAACLDQGVEEVRWTYDPLVAKNAWINLVKLGAWGARFLPDFYGEMPDLINRGDASDRFEVRWRLSSARALRAVRGSAEPPRGGGPVLVAAEGDPASPAPLETGEQPAPGARVAVPLDYHALRTGDPELGQAWREVCGRAFAACFEGGLAPMWITRGGEYVFDRRDEHP